MPLDRLCQAQCRATDASRTVSRAGWRAAPLLVIAGAGTGKTSTLAHRVARLLLAGVPPERMLLLTFTRRAALEMTRRAQKVMAEALAAQANSTTRVPDHLRLPWSGTFHSIGNRLIREYAPRLGLDPGFSVLDRGDAADLMDVVRHRLGFSKTVKRFPRKDTCLGLYSHRVNTQRPLRHTLETAYPWCLDWEEQLTALCRAYVEAKLEQQVLDYDDLLLYWHVMTADPALAAAIGSRFDHVLVDEYQDTNVVQAEILLRLKPDGAGLTVVGDDAQAIYSFRAASIDNILEFPARFTPPARIVTLEENYRSTQPVLDVANALMAEGGAAVPQAPAQRARRRRVAAVRDGARRTGAGDLRRRQRARGARARRRPAAPGGAVPQRRSQRRARTRAHAPQHPVREVRRPQVPRSRAREGPARACCAGPTTRATASRRSACCSCCPAWVRPMHSARAKRSKPRRFRGRRWRRTPCPAATRETWGPLTRLLADIGAENAPWEGQVGRVRQWYEPQLERLYEAAPARRGDLDQLERLSQQHATRESFVTELTLDPPQATGDLAGDPLLDEDYLVLSTVHSAKGQEWESVHVLNVTDGTLSVGVRGRPGRIAGGGAPPALRGDDAGPHRAATDRSRALLRHATARHG